MTLKFVDATTHEPCPTAGKLLCTLSTNVPGHRHIAEHMLNPTSPRVDDLLAEAVLLAGRLDDYAFVGVEIRLRALVNKTWRAACEAVATEIEADAAQADARWGVGTSLAPTYAAVARRVATGGSHE